MSFDVQPLPSSPVKRPFEDDTEMIDLVTDRSSPPLESLNTEPGAQSAKRRKLTAQERLELQALKDLRIREKEETRIRKDEEKRIREEQRKKKIDDLEEKKKRKDDQKRQEDEERQKKERSQLRLNAFFSIPKASKPLPLAQRDPNSEPTTSTSLSGEKIITSAASARAIKPEKSDYEKVFLPFCLSSNTKLAPTNPLLSNPSGLQESKLELESYISNPPVVDISLQDILQNHGIQPPSKLSYDIEPSLSSILAQALIPVPLNQTQTSTSDPLNQLTVRHVHFEQDIRPPYYGTITRVQDRKTAYKLFRRPCLKLIPDTNYEYDSEAEWQADDGEDIDEDDEEIESDEEGEDMEEFLDDENALETGRARMPLLASDLEPKSTGICWQDPAGVVRNQESGEEVDMSSLEIGMLTWPFPHAIDPFSTQYWAPSEPSLPQKTYKFEGSSETVATPTMPTLTTTLIGKSNKRTVPPDILQEFKKEVDGSDLTKIALVEALKKRFPKIPKDALINTLSLVAERVGPKVSDKKWVLKT